MRRNTLHVLLIIAWTITTLSSQTIISNALDFADPAQTHNLLTYRQDQLLGRVLFIHNDTIGFQLFNLRDTTLFLLEDVAFLGVAGEAMSVLNSAAPAEIRVPVYNRRRPPVPLPANQLLFSATALPYPEKGAYRNTMLLVNQADYQFNKNVSIGAGILIPASIMARGQVRYSITDFVHIGLAAEQYVHFFDAATSFHPYTMLTVGEREKFINFTVGYWIDNYAYFDDGRAVYPLISFAASFSFANNWRVYTETVAVFESFENIILPYFMFSHHRHRRTLEFGLVAIPSSVIPLLPLISYGYSF